jgi:predicted SprT family Zn-dependent metalloprotease
MYTIKDVERIAEKLISKTHKFKANGNTYHISPKFDLGYSFEFDNAKVRFGCCKYSVKKITLSKQLCEKNLDKLDTQIVDTILHEIAHALCYHVYGSNNGRGHNRFWRDIAIQIGCCGETYYCSKTIESVESKYTLVCDSCNKTTPLHRKINGRSYSCGDCSPKVYNPKFKMRLIQNR